MQSTTVTCNIAILHVASSDKSVYNNYLIKLNIVKPYNYAVDIIINTCCDEII